MIIAAYAGCGKTTFAERYPNLCVEVVSMPYARILPERDKGMPEGVEEEKAAEYHVNNPIYPMNLVEEVLEMEHKYKYVIIPTVRSAIEILQERYGRDIILCYPGEGLEEEYRGRYVKRGNTETFCQIFADGMSDFQQNLKGNLKAYHIVLKSGEYLSDRLEDIENISEISMMTPVDLEVIESLKDEVKKKKQNVWLDIYFFMDHVFYQVKDIDDAVERKFIYEFAKRLYDTSDTPSIWSYGFDIREDAKEMRLPFKVVDKNGLIEALEKHEKQLARINSRRNMG